MNRSLAPFCLLLAVACGDDFGAAPVLGDLALTTDEDTPITVAVPVNAFETDALGFTLVTLPAHGVVSGEGPIWTYTPEADTSAWTPSPWAPRTDWAAPPRP